MKRQETRFSYVYEDLKRRIVSGQFRPGSKLPSSRNLCEEYNVGIATITRALDALKTEGLIDIQIRRAPVVLSQDLQIQGISTNLEQRDYILQVYKTYELLLPYLLVFAARDCSIEIMPHYRQAQKAARSGVNAESWKALIALTRDILGASQNPLLCDLHTAFELQGNLAYFLEKSIYSRGSIRLRPTFEPKYIRGYTKTLNGKGTVVLTPDQLNTEQALLDFTTKQEALTYLHSLQLMALLSYPVTAYTAPQFSADDLNQLAAHIRKPGIFLTDLLQMILERLSLKPLNVIWIETSRITEWGFYLAFYPQGIGVIEQLNEITRNAYQCLCEGNHEAFAKNLADSYRLILSSVQAYMVEKYKFTEALSVKVP